MYRVEFLPIAQADLLEIVRYISHDLQNPSAADKLAFAFVEATDKLSDFPYACPLYIPLHTLKHEYRKLIVQNYIMFYWIDESNKTVTIARVLYARRDYFKLLADDENALS